MGKKGHREPTVCKLLLFFVVGSICQQCFQVEHSADMNQGGPPLLCLWIMLFHGPETGFSIYGSFHDS